MEQTNNIYPIFDRMLTRQDKEQLLGQRSVMIWFTGLSGSGKSTIAIALERELHKRAVVVSHSRWRQHPQRYQQQLGFLRSRPD